MTREVLGDKVGVKVEGATQLQNEITRARDSVLPNTLLHRKTEAKAGSSNTV